MPAQDDFPRGYTDTAVAAGSGTANIVLPAIPGISHVLDGFTAIILNNIAVAFLVNVTVSTGDGGYNNLLLSSLSIPAVANSINSDSDTDLNIESGNNVSLTVTFSGASPNGTEELLRIKAHDY